ncbi:MAG TPA: MFS transporter, partial [Phycisphaerae bacterium]|nr:MFS transporter [Phycisphaerae bacterium]
MDKPTALELDAKPRLKPYQGLTGYQIWIFIIAALAWFFDCTDQRIFMLARTPALVQLLDQPDPRSPIVIDYATYATAATMIGWAVGGLIFGVMGDRWGRTKTLALSVLIYSIFTGLCGLATGGWTFCVYRFLMGSGIGGAFATAATLVAADAAQTYFWSD